MEVVEDVPPGAPEAVPPRPPQQSMDAPRTAVEVRRQMTRRMSGLTDRPRAKAMGQHDVRFNEEAEKEYSRVVHRAVAFVDRKQRDARCG